MHDVTSYVGIELPQALRSALGTVLLDLKGRAEAQDLALSVVPTQHLHLTLADLGSRPEATQEAARAALKRAAAAHRGFSLTCGGLGTSPARSKTAIVWLGLRDDDGAMAALHESLNVQLARYGFPTVPPAEWTPKIALARVPGDFKPDLVLPRLPTLPVRRLTLFGAVTQGRRKAKKRLFGSVFDAPLPKVVVQQTTAQDEAQARDDIKNGLEARLAMRRGRVRRPRRDRVSVAGDLDA